MPYKKKADPGTVQFNKFIAELPEKDRRLKHKLDLDMDFQNPRKGLITKTNSIGYKVPKKLPGLDAKAKTRMKELQQKAKQSLKGEPSHIIYSTKL